MGGFVDVPKVSGFAEPDPQIPLLDSSETGHFGGIVGGALNQRERLHDRVVDVRGHVRAVLGTKTGPSLIGEVANGPYPPRSEEDEKTEHQRRGADDHVGGGPLLVANPREERDTPDREDHAHARPDRDAQPAVALGRRPHRRGVGQGSQVFALVARRAAPHHEPLQCAQRQQPQEETERVQPERA